MLVYNTIFKVMKRHLTQIIVALVIVIFFSTVMSANYNSTSKPSFTESKVDIAVINNDSNSILSKGLVDFLGEKNNIVDIKQDEESIQDALYFRTITYVLTIPEDFSASYINGTAISLEKATIEDSFDSVDVDLSIDKYLNLYKLYMDTTNLSEEEIVININKDLNSTVAANILNVEQQGSGGQNASYFFNYLNYAILSGFTVCIASILLVFNKFDLKRRNICSPINLTKINVQLFLGILTFGVVSLVFVFIIAFVLFPSTMSSGKGAIFALNTFIFMIVGMSFAFLLGQIFSKSDALDPIATVVSLGTSFIGGCFIPIEFLGDSVVKISKFLPTYWFVSSNTRIGLLNEITFSSLTPIFKNMFVLLAFAAALFAVALVVVKQKRQAEN
jgi:ABC-2 type transport system permease protein